MRIIEACAKFQHRTLSASGRTDQSSERPFSKSHGNIMQYFLFLIAERYMIKSNISAFGHITISLHFRFVHQRKDTSSCDGEVAKLGKVSQGRCQRIESTGTDYQKHDKREQ